MVTWLPDNNNNATGAVKIYIGDAHGVPWGAMKAPVNALAIIRGPLTQVIEAGAYIRVVDNGAAVNDEEPPQGLLIFEFTSEPLDRYAYA